MQIAEGISALKLAQVQTEASVRVVKGANEQAEAVAAILFQGIQQTPQPTSTGVGGKLDIVA